MTSRISKIAAAAIVVLIVYSGILHIGQKNQGVVLGAVTEAMSGMPWVHIDTSIQQGDQIQKRQEWECFDPKVHIWIDAQGVISYRDYSRETAYVYQPHANTITISSTTDRFNKKGPQSPVEAVKHMIARFESKSGDIQREKATQNQIPVEIIHLHDEHQDISLVLDVKRQVPLTMNGKGRIPETDQEYTVSANFDYPAQGPVDIYGLDVPLDAKIIDNRPKGDVQDLIQEVQRRFDTGFADHYAVVLGAYVEEDSQPEPTDIVVMRQKGNLKRVDKYHAFNFTGAKSHIPTLYPLVKDRWPKLTVQDIIALEDNKYGEFQLIFDGNTSTKRTNFSGKVNVDTIRVDMFQMGVIESLAGLAWCSPTALMMSGPDKQIKAELLAEDPKHADWVGFKLVESMHDSSKRLSGTTIQQRISFFWFDPEKDHLLMERKNLEIADEGTRTFISSTLETAQTPDGSWYPKRIQTTASYPDHKGKMHGYTEEKRILLDTNPVFKDGVFDGASLK